MTLSVDAKVLLTCVFAPNPAITLTFKTPERMHPRCRAALEELKDAGIIGKSTIPKVAAEYWSYKVVDKKSLRAIPRATLKEIRENEFSLTVD